MKRDYKEEYIELLENTLISINQKQSHIQKLINYGETDLAELLLLVLDTKKAPTNGASHSC